MRPRPTNVNQLPGLRDTSAAGPSGGFRRRSSWSFWRGRCSQGCRRPGGTGARWTPSARRWGLGGALLASCVLLFLFFGGGREPLPGQLIFGLSCYRLSSSSFYSHSAQIFRTSGATKRCRLFCKRTLRRLASWASTIKPTAPAEKTCTCLGCNFTVLQGWECGV